MGFSATRVGLVLTALGCLYSAFGQASAEVSASHNQSVRELYESFFQKVVILKAAADHPPELNGKVLPVKVMPRLQDAIGLTDGEVEILNAVASDCVSKIGSFGHPPGVIFESRLQQIQFGKVLEPLASQLKDLENRHDEMVMDHVRQLKAAFGTPRFDVLEAYLHSPDRTPRDLAPLYESPYGPGGMTVYTVPVTKKQ